MAPPPSERFRNNMVVFVEDFEEMVEEANEHKVINTSMPILILVKAAITKGDAEEIVEYFIDRTYEHWEKIYEEDDEHISDILERVFDMAKTGDMSEIKKDSVLSKASGLLSKFSGSNAESIKEVFQGEYEEDGETVSIFDDERKKLFWDLLKSFVKISLCHIHETRKINDEGKYTNEYHPKIPVKDLAQKWKVKLVTS